MRAVPRAPTRGTRRPGRRSQAESPSRATGARGGSGDRTRARRRPSSGSSSSEAASRPGCSLSLRHLLAEEAGRPEDKDRDEDAEDDGGRPPRIPEALHIRFDEAEHDPAEHGAAQIADPAEHGSGEREEAEPEAQIELHG